MKRNHLSIVLTVVPWSMLVLGLSLAWLISSVPMNAGNLSILLLGYVCGILPLLLVAVTWLMLVHHKIFTNGWGWITPIILLVISSQPVSQPTIALLFSISLPLNIWAIGVATAILLWHRDLGLKLLGWTSALYVWMLVLAWRFQGNLIELWLQSLNNLAGGSPLWWLNSLWCVVGWVIPLSVLSVVGHTVRLLWQELHSSIKSA